MQTSALTYETLQGLMHDHFWPRRGVEGQLNIDQRNSQSQSV